MFIVLADSNKKKHPPYIIVKQNIHLKDENFPSDAIKRVDG